MATQQQHCKHTACKCMVREGQDYCSESCRQQAAGRQQQAQGSGQAQAGTTQRCQCGHPACQ